MILNSFVILFLYFQEFFKLFFTVRFNLGYVNLC